MRNKKIYFECNVLVADHFSGVGHYVKGIAQAWDRYLGHPDNILSQNQRLSRYSTVLFTSRSRIKHLDKFHLEHTQRKTKTPPAWVPQKLIDAGIPLDLWLDQGTYLFTNFASYPLLRSKSATIVYDISFEIVPQYVDANNAQYLSKVVRKTIKESNLIITISNYTKSELISFYNINPAKVLVAYPAVDRKYFYRRSEWEVDRVKRNYELPDNYILFVGNIEPRKNITTLIDAYTKLPRSYSDKAPLLLVGASGWLNEDIFDKIKKAKQNGYTIARPKSYVDDEDIPAVYSGSSMLVYPSHYEGFGMPPLEAMSCGVPVITSDNTSLPEVVGNAGILVKSTDEKGLTESMIKLLDDESLRDSLVEKGYSQSQKFSWDISAQKIYKALLQLE